VGSIDERLALERATARRVNAAALTALMLAALGVAPAALAQPAAEPASAAASATATTTTAYALDPTHTAVHWEIVHMGTSTIRGRFNKMSGNVQFDAKAKLLDVGITIETASADSGVPVLDVLLRGPEMLATAANPQAFFVARGVRFEGEVPREVRGEFTLRGISQPLTLRATRWKCGLSPVFRREVCGGDFEGELIRSTFGITHSLPFVADKVRLLVQVEGIRQ
jgi:polyisoprenoid-binding protein YceI